MEFKDFAQILRPIIAGELNAAEFTLNLFENITDFTNRDDSVLEDTSMISFKAYYSGARSINNFAKKIRKYLDTTVFETYISDLNEEAQKEIYIALSPYVDGMTDWNVAEKTAEFFKNIIQVASENKRKPAKSAIEAVEQEEESIVKESDYYLLDECNSKCPFCGDSLVKNIKGNLKNKYKHLFIMPLGLEMARRKELEEDTGIKAPENLKSVSNQLVVCFDCYDLYENISPDVYQKLAAKKLMMMQQKNIIDSLDEIDIEQNIDKVIKTFSELKESPIEIKKDDLKVFKVDTKIPEDTFLRENVTGMVLKYYHHVEETFKQYEREGILRFNKVKNEISQCFENLDEQGLSQQKIFDELVEWLYKKSGSENKIACQIIIAFFVQNCEVFYAIPE